MGDLHVTVRYNGEVIDDRVLPVKVQVHLGDGPESEVIFPGAEMSVIRVGEELVVMNRRIKPGQRTGFALGPVYLQLVHLEQPVPPRPAVSPLDLRFLMVAMAVTASGMWLDALSAVARHPAGGIIAEQYERFQRSLEPSETSEGSAPQVSSVQPNADLYAISPGLDKLADRLSARPDDSVTGWAYYPWYRSLVPESPVVRGWIIRPDDVELNALVARDDYQNERWESAQQHYQWLSKVEPGEPEWLLGLASTRKRLGLHRAELETYDRILEADPENFLALGNRAVALARLDRWRDVEVALARMQQAAPDHPYARVFEAMCAALQGREEEALSQLEIAVSRRGLLSDELQIELRRDIALDPAFAPLRADPRLRAMLSRQLGAASPRPRS